MERDGNGSRITFDLGVKIDEFGRIPLKRGIIIAISLASFFTFYDLSNFPYISPVLKIIWHIGDTQIAYASSMTIIGQVIGASCITIFADYYGRKPAFLVTLLVLVAGSILVALSEDITQLSIFRLVTGIGIGAEITIVAAYIGELSPKSKRGKYTSIIFLIGTIGLASSGPVSLLLIQQGKIMKVESWRIIMVIPAVVALILLPFRYYMPESPRWLLSKGRFKETNTILVKIGIGPLENIKKLYTNEIKNNSNRRELALAFRNKQVLFRLLLLVCVWFAVLVPVFASMLLVVEYVNQGYTISQSVAITTIGIFGFVAGTVLSILIADKFERKYQVALAGLILGLTFILRGIFLHDYTTLAVASFIGFASNSWLSTCLFIYTAENFPTSIRSTASGVVVGVGNALATIGPIVFVLLHPIGFLNTMAVLASFSFSAAIIITIFGTRSVGRSLEELNKW